MLGVRIASYLQSAPVVQMYILLTNDISYNKRRIIKYLLPLKQLILILEQSSRVDRLNLS